MHFGVVVTTNDGLIFKAIRKILIAERKSLKIFIFRLIFTLYEITFFGKELLCLKLVIKLI